MEQLNLIATTTMGLEAVVARELEGLGYGPRIVQTGRVAFAGDGLAVCRANLWLRCSDRVLIQVGQFEARDFGELFDRTCALDWQRWIGPDAAFPVLGRSVASQLSSVPACQRIVKKALVEKLRAAHHVETLDESGPTCTVEVALLKDVASLTIDTSGASLHKRGYRTLVGAAPLKETLAAGLVMLSFWRPERPLIDPFCGSGTIPIEAALIGKNIAPGLARQFAAEAWPALPEALWSQAREQARDKQIAADLPIRVIGTDIDPEAIKLARFHAERAGVAGQVHFQQRSFAELTSRREYGCVVCNPPYGQRIGEDEQVRELYQSLPLVLRHLPTWSHFILSARKDLEKIVGRDADRRRKLYNGSIECTYYQFHGPRPPKTDDHRGTEAQRVEEEREEAEGAREAERATVAPAVDLAGNANLPIGGEENKSRSGDRRSQEEIAPVFGGLGRHDFDQAEMFRNRLLKRAHHLRRWPARGITCYRLYDRDIPEVPLAVDVYEGHLHIAEYERPDDRTAAQHADWLDLMARSAAKALDIPAANVFLKRRQRQRGLDQYEKFSDEGRTAIVTEAGLKFRVNLSDYLDTGLFLDHRITRSLVRGESAGLRMLNLFAYTGAFSVYAAAGAAGATTTVDLSNTYLDWARDNMALNGFSGPEHRFVRSDAPSFLLDYAPGSAWDLAVVDPPTFSNSKMTDSDWDVQLRHVEFLTALAERMSKGGVIYFSTNFRRFKLDEPALAAAGLSVHDITARTIPEDFRNKRIHRCWRMVCAEKQEVVVSMLDL
jgi:23S rRNA (guanine2445-N2)-methyltransferase / 23S rRNA (guanine2069-N7)-methyltransferase